MNKGNFVVFVVGTAHLKTPLKFFLDPGLGCNLFLTAMTLLGLRVTIDVNFFYSTVWSFWAAICIFNKTFGTLKLSHIIEMDVDLSVSL